MEGTAVIERTARRNPKILARSARIFSGLILLAFVTTHLLNASLGLISLEAMDDGARFLTGVWGFPPLSWMLALAFVAHFLLGLWSVYERPTLKTNTQDMIQLTTALLVVPLMATHVLGVYMSENFGFHLDYAGVIRLMWIEQPTIGLLQVVVVSVVWIHGCAGLLIWMRSMEKARNIILWVYPIAIAIPVLSLLGFSEAGRKAIELGDVVITATADQPAVPNYSPDEMMAIFTFIKSTTNWTIWTTLGLAVLALLARAVRGRLSGGRSFSVTRDGQSLAPSRPGLSLFDTFQQQNEPHAGLCQGRGRCGTCAVRILSSEFPLPEPSEMERLTLLKKGLGDEARLACQLKPDGGQVVVEAVYPADFTYSRLDEEPPHTDADAEKVAS